MPQCEIKSLVVPFELDVKAVTSTGEFEGYGAVFNNMDYGRDVIKPGAFRKTLKEWKRRKQMPAMFWHHNDYQPVGEWLEMAEDEKGLFVKGQLWVEGNSLGRKPIEAAEMVRNLVTSNGPKGLSIGYSAKDYKFEDHEGTRARILKELGLFEVSPVPFGMNPKAEVTNAKALSDLADEDGQVADIRSFEKFLRDAGLSQKQAKALLSDGYKSLLPQEEQRDAGLGELVAGIKSITENILNQ
jgi:hypothetical protein